MSLDIPEPQVLVSTGNDQWEHWVLLRRQQDAVWLALDPGSTVEVLDLKVHRIIALARNQDFPLDPEDFVHTFSIPPTDRDLRDAHARANRTASLLGLPSGPPTGIAGGFAPSAILDASISETRCPTTW